LIAQAHYTIIYRNDPALVQKLIDDLHTLEPGMAEANLLQAELFITTKQDIPAAKKLLERILKTPNTPDWVSVRAKELLKKII
jgi:hypothetical protein